jgi:hypothetical protein
VLTAQKIVIKHDHSGVIPIRINVMAEPDVSSSLIRSLLPYTSAAVIVATLYAGWTIWSRHQSTMDAVQAQKQQEAQRDEAVVHELGDGNLKILSFYASPGVVKAGEKALVCYGVSNAKEVKIDPPLDDVGPSLSRCLEARPRKTTEYTLTARDAAGHEARQSVTLQVAR